MFPHNYFPAPAYAPAYFPPGPGALALVTPWPPQLPPLTCRYPPRSDVFRRVGVDFSVRGTTIVSWFMDPHFWEPQPWSFQLQAGQADVASGNWVDVGAPVINTFQARSGLRLAFGKEQNVFYRVRLTTALANTYYSLPASVTGDLPWGLWHKAQEITRKETLRLTRLAVAAPGVLLKTLQAGTPCSACTDPNGTDEQTDGQCPTCFGQRFVGGYYPAQACIYFDMAADQRYNRQDLQAGMVNPRDQTARVLAAPYLSTYDVWVPHATDVRYYVHQVQVLAQMHQVPLVYQAQLKFIPLSDVVYQYPVP